MKNKLQSADILALAVLMATHVATAWQSHFSVLVWTLPLIALLSWVFLRVWVPRMPASLRIPGPEREARMMGLAVVLLICVMQLIVVLQPRQQSDRVTELMIVTALFFVVAGLILPKVRQNRWLGVRVPWTLSSAETWSATHRVAGASMVCAGVLTLPLSATSHTALAGVVLGAGGLVPIVYSWWHYTTHHHAG